MVASIRAEAAERRDPERMDLIWRMKTGVEAAVRALAKTLGFMKSEVSAHAPRVRAENRRDLSPDPLRDVRA